MLWSKRGISVFNAFAHMLTIQVTAVALKSISNWNMFTMTPEETDCYYVIHGCYIDRSTLTFHTWFQSISLRGTSTDDG